MLTRAIKLRLTRSIIRTKAISSSSASHPIPLPPLTSLHLPEIPSQPFPLYHPPAPSSSTSSHRFADQSISAGNLPSDKALQKRVKLQLTRAVEKDLEEYTEDDLRGFYAAVVQSGVGEAGPSRHRLISGPEGDDGRRIAIGDGKEEEGLVRRVAERLNVGTPGTGLISSQEGEKELLSGVIDALGRFASEQEDSVGGSSTGLSRRNQVSLGLLSGAETRALMYETVKARDPARLANLLETLSRIGASIEREYITTLLDGLIAGDSRTWAVRDENEQRIIATLAGILKQQESLLPAEQDSLTRLHLSLDPSATSAIAHLRRSESRSLPPPESSYNLVLSHLTTASSTSSTRALAWDLFTHMRLVAHPSPSQLVYRTMIASCAASTEPKPEMARDLWIQMTQDQKLDPAEPDYTAYILALCSTKSTYLEGFDVFRQMLARHNDATYVPFQVPGQEGEDRISEFLPTTQTWKALLEGTKRAGDLARTRWVLSECVRLHTLMGGKGVAVDEDIMASVFMAYAAWKPTLKRSVVRGQIDSAEKDKDTPQTATSAQEREYVELHEQEQSKYTDIERSGGGDSDMFADRLPMTSSEALHEASLLFDAIISANTPSRDAQQATPPIIFTNVRLTARLINSYLSVIYSHASSLADCRKAWEEVWSRIHVEKNGWSYLHALERCSAGQRGRSNAAENRQQALDWAKQLWTEYQTLLPALLDRILRSANIEPGLAYFLGVSPRQIESSWRAIIRSHALHNETDTALSLLSEFHNLYPPTDILRSYSPLISHDFPVKFTDPTSTTESHVPPHILFKDVDVLHQRLVRDEKWDQVGKVKWICQSYEGALGKRRKWRLTGVGWWRERRERLVMDHSSLLQLGLEEAVGLEEV